MAPPPPIPLTSYGYPLTEDRSKVVGQTGPLSVVDGKPDIHVRVSVGEIVGTFVGIGRGGPPASCVLVTVNL